MWRRERKGGGYSVREGLGGLRGMGMRGEGVYYKLRGPLSLQGWPRILPLAGELELLFRGMARWMGVGRCNSMVGMSGMCLGK